MKGRRMFGSARFDVLRDGRFLVRPLRLALARPGPGPGGGWPATDSPKYALVAKVTAGLIWSTRTGRLYHANEWFPVGADSRCVQFQGWNVGIPQLVFSYNDPNLGDNGGGAQVAVKQWW